MAAPRSHLVAMSNALSRLPPDQHPMHNPAAFAKLAPNAQANLRAIAADPSLSSMAASGSSLGSMGSSQTPAGAGAGGSVTDATGAANAQTRDGGDLGWGAGYGHKRMAGVRHVLLGITPVALLAGAGLTTFNATPKVDFKPDRMVTMPGYSGTVAAVVSGIRPQYVNQAAEDAEMYSPASYGGELDLNAVRAAVSISGQVSNGNATAAQTFYGAFIGEAVGKAYRTLTSKLQVGSLGTSGSVAASGAGSLVLTPLIEYTPRKLLFTPGASFADAFIITNITAGIQPQLMSGDPIPASVFTDLFPLFVDFDLCKTNTPLTVYYQNVSAGAAVLKGSSRGDCDPQDLVRYGGLDDIAAA